jgi:hypothetical protein
MDIIRKILSVLGLAAVFIWLSIFSLQTYRSDNLTFEAQDKTPVVSIILDKLNFILVYLGQNPSLGLLPVSKMSSNYEQAMTDILTKNEVSGDTLSKMAAPANFQDLWQNLKANMRHDSWSTR